jgi:hypothetical protein
VDASYVDLSCSVGSLTPIAGMVVYFASVLTARLIALPARAIMTIIGTYYTVSLDYLPTQAQTE